MPDLGDILRKLDAEVAVQRKHDPDAFTTGEYADANGVALDAARRRLKALVAAGRVVRSWKQLHRHGSGTSLTVAAWKLTGKEH